MASINEKLNYINETKSLIKDKLNDLGSEIEDETTFREYAEKIEDLYDEWPKINDEDTIITLNNTKKGKMNLQLKGNTNQFTTTGKNLCSTSLLPITKNGITISKNENGDIVINGTPDYNEGYVSFFIGDVKSVEAGTYTSSVVNKRAGIGINFGGFGGALNITMSDTAKTKTATSNETYTINPQINIRYDAGTFDNFIFNPMFEKQSTATDYEPYTGGIASPNPDYPQDIKIVTGENTINVTSYNLLDFCGVSQESKVTVNDDGTVTLNGTGGFSLNFKEIDVIQGTTYSTFVELISGTITGSPINGTGLMSPLGKGNWLSNNIQDTYIPNENKKRHSIWVGDQGTYNNAKFRIWAYVGSTPLPYEPYQDNIYNINLPEGMELCKIENYQDYFYKDSNKWYLHKEIGKYNKWTSVNVRSAYTNTTRFQFILTYPTTSEKRAYLLSNYFRNAINNNDTEHLFVGTGTPNVYDGLNVFISNSRVTTSEEAINWLQTNRVAVYYALETPIDTEITYQLLIDQLNELEKTQSKENQTDIKQVNNGLSFIINATALIKNSD